MKLVSRGIDRVAVQFNKPELVANAELLLVATMAAWASKAWPTPRSISPDEWTGPSLGARS